MKVKGIDQDQLTRIVRAVSDSHYGGNIRFNREPERVGNFVHFTLTVRSSYNKGAKRSNTGRRIAACCWHAHRDVMIALFSENPDALLVTAMARYEGRSGFEALYPATGDVNTGSMAQPLYYADACECEGETSVQFDA